MQEKWDDVLEVIADKPSIKKIKTTDEVLPIKNVGQCGAACPDNGPDHRGACYLDFGHSDKHKCSVDGHEWG